MDPTWTSRTRPGTAPWSGLDPSQRLRNGPGMLLDQVSAQTIDSAPDLSKFDVLGAGTGTLVNRDFTWAEAWADLGLRPTLDDIGLRLGPILDQSWADFGPTSGQLWANFGTTLG